MLFLTEVVHAVSVSVKSKTPHMVARIKLVLLVEAEDGQSIGFLARSLILSVNISRTSAVDDDSCDRSIARVACRRCWCD